MVTILVHDSFFLHRSWNVVFKTVLKIHLRHMSHCLTETYSSLYLYIFIFYSSGQDGYIHVATMTQKIKIRAFTFFI